MIVLLLPLALASPVRFPLVQDARHETVEDTVYWDSLDDHGALFGGVVRMRVPDKRTIEETETAPWESLTHSVLPVDPAHRIDLVIVGDGYTSAQIPTYAAQANSIASQFFSKQPYTAYQGYFTVHRVDVVSVDSGVDHDPAQGTLKSTALDMGFWCGGTERLLCVSVSKAYQFANNAPDADLVLAIANSTKYGGAGYSSSDLATCAAANSSSLEIVRHEFGHALGNLADEYTYGGTQTYTGGEPSAVNVSKLLSAQMLAQQAKWWRWIGASDPAFDGLVSTFEGAAQHELGIWRPTNNSLMRNLGRPFNLPCAEKLIVEIYKMVPPIEAHSSTSATYAGTETLFVTPMQPVGHSLAVQWSLDGTPIPGATGTTLDLAALGLGACSATVSVRVVDSTPLVRDEALRAQWMTQTKSFQVVGGAPQLENVCVAAPNSVGPGATMSASGSASVSADDLVLTAIGCPPGASGLFYYGDAAIQAPFGNGWRCVTGNVSRLPVLTTTVFGDAVQALELGAMPGGAIAAGQTKVFQLWYRNPAAGGAGFNLSDALRVRFCS